MMDLVAVQVDMKPECTLQSLHRASSRGYGRYSAGQVIMSYMTSEKDCVPRKARMMRLADGWWETAM